MFVFLSKFLPPLLYPLGLTLICLALALILRRRPRVQTILIAAAIFLLLVGSNRWVSYVLARSLEWRYLPMESIPQTEAIVVLGGGTESAQYPRPMVEMNSAGDRILYGAMLYKEGRAPNILLSGGNITWLNGRQMTPANEMADLLQLMNVPANAIWLQPKSQNTYEDALYSSQILKEKGVERILLVTSAMHMPRSVALFEHQGIEVIPAPVDYTVTESGWDSVMTLDIQSTPVYLMPNASALSLTTNVLKEYIGMWVYRIRGWL